MRTFIRMPLVVMALLVMSGSALPGQTPATAQLMRAKLGHSQRVLEALMTSNYAVLERESTALSAATKAPGWAVLQTPEYARYSTMFTRGGRGLGRRGPPPGFRRGRHAVRLAYPQLLSMPPLHERTASGEMSVGGLPELT